MTIKRVRAGLYERTGTPKQVRISREFVESVRKHSGSSVLEQIMEDAIREQERRPAPDQKEKP
jgi:hypothetical protein